jgi:hypothetical protein
MKTKINETEIKNILELHSKEKNSKNVISEQSQDLVSKLQSFIDSGCITGGIVVSMTASNPNYKKAIKKQSVKNPENTVYYFIDNTLGVKDKSGNFKTIEGKWNCNSAQKAAKEASTQATTTDSNNNLNQMKLRGWMEYSELVGKGFSTLEAKEGKYETTQFDMGNGNKITLYKPKNIGGELKQYTKVQQDLLNKYTKSGYKLKSQIGLDEIGSWEQFTLNFPDGSGSVVLYKDPSFVTNVTVGSEPSVEKQGALISGEKRAKVCREKIKDFADSANKKLKLPMSQINADKTFVMACRDQFGMKYNDLGVTKKNLEYLTGQRDGLDGYKLKVGSPYRL